MKVRIGIVGYRFARDFSYLFKAHPDVEKICVAELSEEKRQIAREDHPDIEIYNSYDEMLEQSDINCVAIFTQRHLHGPMVMQALRAGKHVYSAVPIGCTIEEIKEIVALVKETRLIYMMGETCCYYPAAMFCREKYREGAFGKFVYAEAQYYHCTREMYPDYMSNGENWRRKAGIPPMFYPTHSISMILSALGQHATQVSCMGYRDDYPDDIFGEDKNDFQNPFSNETAIFRMSGGGVVRINEFRRIGINKPSTYITCFYGEDGAYDCISDKHLLQTVPLANRDGVVGEMRVTDVSEELLPINYLKFKRGEIKELRGKSWDDHVSPVDMCLFFGDAAIQKEHMDRIPKSFLGITTGNHHMSHLFLVDDFVRAVVDNKLPPNNAWDAARYMIPGLVAHESALQGGKLLDIPDLGDAPEDWERLTYEKKDYYNN